MVFIPQIKDGTYKINLDEYHSIGTHWIAIFVKNDVATSLNIFQKKLKIHRQYKFKKYL